MSESHTLRGREAKELPDHLARHSNFGPNGHLPMRHRIKQRISEFGVAVTALAQHAHKKPAEWLAHLARCTPRNAQRIIDGDRKVTAVAMHSVEGKMLGQ